MSHYLLAIDQGTTSSRAILFTREGKIHALEQREFPQIYPDSGWVEHDPEAIWQSVKDVCQALLDNNGVTAADIIGVGITNQRETTVLWDRATGEPVYNAIVWQDRRTAGFCQQVKDDGHEPRVTAKTGLLIDPYFSATKIRWILENVDEARERAERGELAFGTIDTFLLWRLTGGRSFLTDATNASRTMLFNIHEQRWDQELLELFQVPENLLPDVRDCASDFGTIAEGLPGGGATIGGIAGDQQAALFGQTCFAEGTAKSTYGTGCFLIMNTGEQALVSEHRLLTTVGYRLDGRTTYAVEGSIFIAGAAIQWLRDGLRLIEIADECEPLAEQTPVDHGVYLIPAFTGLGAPHWDPKARGALFGLTRDTGIKEIVTAGLQSVCYQTKDLQKAMEDDGMRPVAMRVDGGMVVNNWVLQFLADVLGTTVSRPEIIETTALGVAYLAGLQAGVYQNLDEIEKLWRCDREFQPMMSKPERDRLYQGWLEAVRRLQ